MSKIVFVPVYRVNPRLVSYVMVMLTLMALLLIMSGVNRSVEVILSAILFGLASALMPHLFVRRIIFTEHYFSIERFILPDKIIEYECINDFNGDMIKTSKGNIGIGTMVNSGELLVIINTLIKEGNISRQQIEYKLVREQRMASWASIFSIVCSFGLTILMDYFWPSEESFVRNLRYLAVFLLIYSTIYLVHRVRAGNK